jgi:hypothetical protein
MEVSSAASKDCHIGKKNMVIRPWNHGKKRIYNCSYKSRLVKINTVINES